MPFLIIFFIILHDWLHYRSREKKMLIFDCCFTNKLWGTVILGFDISTFDATCTVPFFDIRYFSMFPHFHISTFRHLDVFHISLFCTTPSDIRKARRYLPLCLVRSLRPFDARSAPPARGTACGTLDSCSSPPRIPPHTSSSALTQ